MLCWFLTLLNLLIIILPILTELITTLGHYQSTGRAYEWTQDPPTNWRAAHHMAKEASLGADRQSLSKVDAEETVVFLPTCWCRRPLTVVAVRRHQNKNPPRALLFGFKCLTSKSKIKFLKRPVTSPPLKGLPLLFFFLFFQLTSPCKSTQWPSDLPTQSLQSGPEIIAHHSIIVFSPLSPLLWSH